MAPWTAVVFCGCQPSDLIVWLYGRNGKMTNQCLFQWWATWLRESESFYICMWTMRSLGFHSVYLRTAPLLRLLFFCKTKLQMKLNSFFLFLWFCISAGILMSFPLLTFTWGIYRNRRHGRLAHVFRPLVQLILFAVLSQWGGLLRVSNKQPWWRFWMSAAGGQKAYSCSTSCLGGVKLCFVLCQVVHIFDSQVA